MFATRRTDRLPPEARLARTTVADHLDDLQRQLRDLERAILRWHRQNEASRRLASIQVASLANSGPPVLVNVGPRLLV